MRIEGSKVHVDTENSNSKFEIFKIIYNNVI